MAEKRVILTGFMGVGKSTIGPMAAEALGVDYYDTDNWMETELGIDIPSLVRTDIAQFRALEAGVLREILGEAPAVVSTGGGIVSTEVGRNALLSAGVPVMWLRAPFEVSAQRVSEDTGRERPLFQDEATARALYEERLPLYNATATYVIAAAQAPEQVVGDIVDLA